MRVCLQRVQKASVSLKQSGKITGSIGPGFLLLLGVCETDSERDAEQLAEKVVHLRIFEDAEGKMNRPIADISGQMLVISQFTLYADCRKGRRPSFTEAARPEKANALYQHFIKTIRSFGIPVQEGVFQAEMSIELINDGPVTIWIDSAHLSKH
ncbi:MAG: D-aminoacyl-tRNA deacylase [Thermoguttaceae bacterium]